MSLVDAVIVLTTASPTSFAPPNASILLTNDEHDELEFVLLLLIMVKKHLRKLGAGFSLGLLPSKRKVLGSRLNR